MKVNLISKLDLTKLNKEIDIFKGRYQQQPYMFVNEETAEALSKETIPDWMLNLDKNSTHVVVGTKQAINESGVIYTYQGIKVFYNEDLKFGEVELR